MQYRKLGKWGIKLSEIALGSWMTDLTGTAACDTAKATLKLAFDKGVNFFDCADAYSGGAAERFLGSLLKEYPGIPMWYPAKCSSPWGPAPTTAACPGSNTRSSVINP